MSDSKVAKKPKSKARKIIEWVLTGIFVALFGVFAVGQVTGMVHKKDNYGQTLMYGYGGFLIKTNSMEPVYPVNTAIITYKASPEDIVKKFDNNEIVDITFIGQYFQNNSTYDYSDYRPGNISYGGIDYKLEGNEPVFPSGELSYTPITHRLIDYHIDEGRELGKGKYTFVVAGINTGGELSKEGQYQLLTENELLGIVKVNSKVVGGFFRFITTPWGLLIFLLIPAFYLVVTSVLDIFKAMKEPEEGEKPVEGKENVEAPKQDSGGSSNNALEGLSQEDKERLKREMLEQMMSKKKGK